MNSLFSKHKISALIFTALVTSLPTHAMSYDDSFVFEPEAFTGPYGIKLVDLDQTKKALSTGAVVTASMDLNKCTLSTGTSSRNLAGGLKVDNYLIERDGTLRFASFRTTLSSRSDVAVTQNNKYKVSSNGDVTFTSSVFSMPEYKLISKVDVYCKLNESFHFYMAY